MIKIEKLIFKGYGLGHDEFGKTYMIKKSVPEDVLEVEVTKDKKKYAEAKIKSIVVASPLRDIPTCPYFDACGGCEHQNISYDNQLKLKQAIFAESLARQGIETQILPIKAGSDQEFHYRNVIRYYFYIDSKKQAHLAMHDFADSSRLIPIHDCLLQSQTGAKIANEILDFINQNAKNKSNLYQLRFREGSYTGDFMIELVTLDHSLPYQDKLKEFITAFPQIKSFFHTIAPEHNNYNWERRLIFGSPIIFEKIGKFSFQISPESFFQTNSAGAKALYDEIKSLSEIKIGDNILDLYCGTGTIGIYLSTLAKKITGVEVIQSAINDAKSNAKINHVVNTEFICADVAKWLKQNKTLNLNKIIVDPPRDGLTRNIILDICNMQFDTLIYVSCNPATFARDTKIFQENGLALSKVQPIDIFPQTHHIECIGMIKKP
ncbi:MAG: 23S rRNA (uracil(1939)-C(5))-methyltransferase RlmD [bacterium]